MFSMQGMVRGFLNVVVQSLSDAQYFLVSMNLLVVFECHQFQSEPLLEYRKGSRHVGTV